MLWFARSGFNMKFKVISCWYGFSNHVLWSTDESKWVNIRDEAVCFELVPTCQTEIRFTNGHIFCSEERRVDKNKGIYINSSILSLNNGEKYGDDLEFMRALSSMGYEPKDDFERDKFFHIAFYCPIISSDFKILKQSIIDKNSPDEIHIRFERNDKKTFSYDMESNVVDWDTSVEGEKLEPGSLWFQWNRD